MVGAVSERHRIGCAVAKTFHVLLGSLVFILLDLQGEVAVSLSWQVQYLVTLACRCCNVNWKSHSALHHIICSAHCTKHCSYHDVGVVFCLPKGAPRILLEVFYVTSMEYSCSSEYISTL